MLGARVIIGFGSRRTATPKMTAFGSGFGSLIAVQMSLLGSVRSSSRCWTARL